MNLYAIINNVCSCIRKYTNQHYTQIYIRNGNKMKIDRTKNATRNIFWGLINKCITLLLPFVLRTIMLKIMGSDYLGLNSIFTSILQVLNLAELGFSSAVVFSMYKPIAEDDKTTICALMNFYKTVYRVIGIIVLVAGIILLPFIQYLIKGPAPSDVNIYVLYLIYLINTALSYFLFAYKSALLNAHQRADITSNINSIVFIIQYGLQIAAIIIFKNYYIYIIIQPVFTIANNIITAIITNKRYPEYKCSGHLSKDIVSQIKQQVGGLMIQKLCITTRNSLDSIIISAFIGLTSVTIYNNYFYIISSLHAILGIVLNSLRAGVGNSIAVETVEKNHYDMHKFMFIYAWIAGWCTICLACIYQDFMVLWAGEELLFPVHIMISFCIYFYLMSLGDIRNLYMTGAGLWWEGRYRSIMESLANLVLNIALGHFFGVFGIIIATILSLSIINFGYGSHIVFKFYFKNGKLGFFFTKHALYAFITLIIGCITYAFCSFIDLHGFIGILVKGGICIIVPNIFYLLVYSRTKLFKDSLIIGKNVISVIKKRI